MELECLKKYKDQVNDDSIFKGRIRERRLEERRKARD
jgi:hypothetical protein